MLAVAADAAHSAAEVIRNAAERGVPLVWEEKGAADFVTEVDRDAESCIVTHLRAAYPEAAILGEEFSPADLISIRGLTFVVDPLDGTTNFLHAYPQYAVSIAALIDGDVVTGVVLNAANGELFTATRGGGAHRSGKRISVSAQSDPSHALIGTGFPFKKPELLDEYSGQFVRVSRNTAGIRRAGSAALDLADVACARFDGFWELDLAPWDIATGLLLVREAGGIVTDLGAAPKQVAHGPVVAGNPDIHRWLLKTLHGAS
ncbi:MAG: inositol monophosphatase [Gemmatimonadaceae bacterium]|nr:inositol monophosphatase [Gemmatimonadaceae bacterium]